MRLWLVPLALQLSAAAPICLQTIRIDHTDVPNDRTIMFYMRGGAIYRNTLPTRCPGLGLDPRGFTYEPIPGSDEICSNLVTIRLNTTHAVCLLGPFEPVK